MESLLKYNDLKCISEIVKVLERERYFLITSHQNLDGDAIGSELALYSALKSKGKDVMIVNQDTTPAIYRFLPWSRKVQTSISKISVTPDVAIVIDCGSPERTGNISRVIKKARTLINIDHHFSNSDFADINWVNHNFSATGEMIYFLLLHFKKDISKKEAECLYTAILTDTGNFIYNLKPSTLSVVQNLINKGASPEEIARKVYLERPLNSFKLLSLALNTLQFDKTKKVCWMKVTRDMYRITRTKEEDTEEFIDLLVKIKEANIVFLLKETDSMVKVSLRSKGRCEVESIASKFGGGGHKKAAGCHFKSISIDEAEKMILKEISTSS